MALNEDLAGEVWSLFDPDSDEGYPWEIPHPRLSKVHKLDTSYLRSFAPEGSSTNQYSRICGKDDRELHAIDRNMDIPVRLLVGALRLLGDSIVEYDGLKQRVGDIRYYPPIIMTFWSGFEAFVRYTSELLTITVPSLPEPVKNNLKEQDVTVDDKGKVKIRTRYYPVLDRYWLLLSYGYGFKADRGSTYWQKLRKAQAVRDYYTHVGIRDSRAITCSELIDYLENVLLGIIIPSCYLKRTLLLNVHHLYCTWAELKRFSTEYCEQPFFHDKPFDEGYMFHCNFENVDTHRFPNFKEKAQ